MSADYQMACFKRFIFFICLLVYTFVNECLKMLSKSAKLFLHDLNRYQLNTQKSIALYAFIGNIKSRCTRYENPAK